MAPNFFRRFRSGQVVNFAVVGVGLPLLAVGLSKYFGESQESLESKMDVAFEDRIKSREAAVNTQRIQDFIKQQATNQDADYSEILSSGRGKIKRQKELDRPSDGEGKKS